MNATAPPAPAPAIQHDKRFTLYGPDGQPMDCTPTRASSSEGHSLNDLSRMIGDVIGGGTSHHSPNQTWTDRESVEKLDHWVFVCVGAIRDGVSKVPLKAFAQPSGEELLKANDQIVKVVHNVNPLDTRIDLWSWTMTFLELTGNSIWLKARDGFGVAELWPLPSHRVRPHHERGRPLACYKFDTGDGNVVDIPPEDIVHIKYPNPHNRFWGLGTLQHAAEAYRAHDKIRASQLAAFNNEILASLYFHCDGLLDDDRFRRLKSMLLERYGGTANARIPLLLENSTQVGQLFKAPKEMDYRESAGITRDEILAIFGVTPIHAGIVDNANRSNSDKQDEIFWGRTILTRCVRIQERMTKDPDLSPDGREWRFDDPTPKNPLNTATIQTKHVQAGDVAPNDVRRENGQDETAWGEYPKWVWELMLKHNLDELSVQAVADRNEEARERADALTEQLTNGGGGDDDEEGGAANDEEDDDTRGVVRRSAGQGGGLAGLAHRQPAPVRRSEELTRIIEQARTEQTDIESAAAKALRKYFSRQLDRILKNVRRLFDNLPQREAVNAVRIAIPFMRSGDELIRLYPDGSLIREVGTFEQIRMGQAVVPQGCLHSLVEVASVNIRAIDPEQTDSLDDWPAASAELAKVMEQHIKRALKAGGDLTFATLPITGAFDLRNPYAEQFLAEKGRDYWLNSVSATTKALLSEKLGEVLAAGATVDQLEEAVKLVFGGETQGKPGGGKYGKGRFASARTIARTEVIGSYNAGSDIQRTESGVKTKEWVATFDDRTRLTHVVADGQRVTQGGTFSVGGAKLRYPGDPEGPVAEIVNCRCFSVPIIEEGDLILDPADQ
jgi:HK97 family phage portal protein